MFTMLKQDFARLSVFQGLSETQLELLDSMFERVYYEPDELIFEQGQPARYLYILVSGEVVIRYKPYDGPALVVSHIQPGGVFGWSTVLSRRVYTSGAVALQECNAFRISEVRLHDLCIQQPETGSVLMEHLASAIAERRITHSPILNMLSSRMENEDCKRRITDDD